MCGIAGFISPLDSPENRAAAVGRMCAAMLHRGPDDSGIESHGDATIGMRRLAIFDPANGHQPMATPDGRFHVVFNGAIYNFRALRAELQAAGFSFRTNCDTEVLLAAYAHWGEAALRRLRGMFAFAVWDNREQTLFLARDAFGIKPLYYRHDDQRLVFASELNALLTASSAHAVIDPLSVADYLGWFAVPAPRTIYRDIFSLRPGECATFRAGRLEIRTYWNFSTIPRDIAVCTDAGEFTRELRARLDDTIRAHVVADVPVGAFLSGGLDSAVVVGLMSKVSSSKLRTFSIGFDEGGYSEADAAAETARHFGTEHHPSVLTGAKVAADLETLLAALDQPTGDGINTYYASQAAHAGGVKVALSGLGGDELFGGYPSFRDVPRIAAWLPLWRTLPDAAHRVILGRMRRGGTWTRKLADLLQYGHNLSELCALRRTVFSAATRRSLLSADALEAIGARAPHHPELAALSADLSEAGPFSTISAWELRTYMADVLLRDSDVMSMRHSLELRVPFVDRPLIEWLWRQPAAFKRNSGSTKSALIAAVSELLPPGLSQRRKQGFSLPFPIWMRRELRPFLEETFSDSSLDRSGLFAREPVQRFWRGFLAGSDSREWSRVWSLAVLVAFTNRRPTSSALPKDGPRGGAVLLRPNEPHRDAPKRNDVGLAPAPHPSRPRAPSATLLLAPELFASEGGIPRILQLYLKGLCDLAVPDGTVRLVALNDAQLDSDDLRRTTNDRLDGREVCQGSKSRFIRAALRLSKGCEHLICGHVAQLPVALAAKTLHPRLRYYLVAHGIEVWRPFSLAERLALRGAEKIFCVSEYTRRELLKNCRLPEAKVVVLPNALDPSFAIAAAAAPCGPRVILVVTRLSSQDRYKGVDHLIAALPAIRVALPDVTLRIIGRGDDGLRLQTLRDQLGLHAAVEFLGYVDDRRLTEELQACSLFALPSEREGFGLVFLEAMASGRPCLGARAGGIPEVITPDTGVLADYGDVPGIAAAAIAALRRDWNPEAILDRARHFSYSQFKTHLGCLLSA
ncbi:MAG: asparagine synthase (glutamine-hydrolyzing) [Opitutaceae bacterium]